MLDATIRNRIAQFQTKSPAQLDVLMERAQSEGGIGKLAAAVGISPAQARELAEKGIDGIFEDPEVAAFLRDTQPRLFEATFGGLGVGSTLASKGFLNAAGDAVKAAKRTLKEAHERHTFLDPKPGQSFFERVVTSFTQAPEVTSKASLSEVQNVIDAYRDAEGATKAVLGYVLRQWANDPFHGGDILPEARAAVAPILESYEALPAATKIQEDRLGAAIVDLALGNNGPYAGNKLTADVAGLSDEDQRAFASFIKPEVFGDDGSPLIPMRMQLASRLLKLVLKSIDDPDEQTRFMGEVVAKVGRDDTSRDNVEKLEDDVGFRWRIADLPEDSEVRDALRAAFFDDKSRLEVDAFANAYDSDIYAFLYDEILRPESEGEMIAGMAGWLTWHFDLEQYGRDTVTDRFRNLGDPLLQAQIADEVRDRGYGDYAIFLAKEARKGPIESPPDPATLISQTAMLAARSKLWDFGFRVEPNANSIAYTTRQCAEAIKKANALVDGLSGTALKAAAAERYSLVAAANLVVEFVHSPARRYPG